MNWNDLQSTWAGQKLAAGPATDWTAIQRDFEAKRRRLARGLFWRDVREAAAGVFVAGVFAYSGWRMGPSGWPIAVAVLLMLGLTGFFISERMRVRRRQVGAAVALLTRLDAEIAELKHQRNLLRRVGTWYLGPCVAAGVIFGATTMAQAPIPAKAKLAAGGLMVVVFAVVSWMVLALNRMAVRRQIEPRLQELEKLHQSLSSP